MIYITGDTHGDFTRFRDSITRKIRKGDTLIVCGDFGFIWDGSRAENNILKKIGDLRYTVAFIDGCHENYNLLEQYPDVEWNGGTARAITGNLVQLKRGQVYTIEGKKFFTFGGGLSQDIEIRRETNSWYEQEQPTREDVDEGMKNLKAHEGIIDYIITHEPPQSLKKCLDLDIYHHLETDAFFEQILSDCIYDKWFFGKCHINKIIPPKFYALFDNVIRLEGRE
ncbi:MAG: hypothetical protein MJ095_07340 [Oscillospiraceae bacterium]|nr:hypothetical protein [Oscillospiraceae bacterium]